MRKLLAIVGVAAIALSCGNNDTTTKTEVRQDSVIIKQDTNRNTESNTVTPPASNGQY